MELAESAKDSSPGYSDVVSYSRLFDLMQPDLEVVTAVLDVMQPKAIVEIGCGSGRLLPLYLRSKAAQIIGIDLEPGMVTAFASSPDDRVRAKAGDVREPIPDISGEALVVITSSLLKHLIPADRERAWRALAQGVGENQAIYVDHSAMIYGVEELTAWVSYADLLSTWWPVEFFHTLRQFEWRKDVDDKREVLYFRRNGERPNRIEGYRYDPEDFVKNAATEGFSYFPIADRYPASRHFKGERRIGLMVRSDASCWADIAHRIRVQAYGS